jgi:UDP-N-acetyl-D-glucosamine dehydrogenase
MMGRQVSSNEGASVNLLQAIEDRKAVVGVIGLGYVGLPLVELFAGAGFPVIGYDIDVAKIDKLRRGKSPIGHISDARISSLIKGDRFRPTCEVGDLARADAILICVPTPLTETREPDLSYVTGTAEGLAPHLRAGQLVILESTTYPGTTEEVMQPLLETSGLKAGKDFYLAYSPEREDPGNAKYSAASIPKVVGGIDAESREAACCLYRQVVVEVVPVSGTRPAEACKLLENTYRAINIALINELKVLFDRMGIGVWEVIEAARTKPFGFQAFYPGPGLGGHCIPIDPFYLAWLARRYELSTRFVELAGEVNTSMPGYVVTKIAEALNDQSKPLRGSKVCVLGVAYKKDVDDPRESPAFVIMEKLLAQGAEVSYNDPHIPRLPRMRRHHIDLDSQPLTPQFLAAQDCVVVVTDHSAYKMQEIVDQSRLVVDTRGATRGLHVPEGRVVRA